MKAMVLVGTIISGGAKLDFLIVAISRCGQSRVQQKLDCEYCVQNAVTEGLYLLIDKQDH